MTWMENRNTQYYNIQGGQIHPGCHDGDSGRDSIYHYLSCVTAHPECFIRITTGDGKYILTIIYL